MISFLKFVWYNPLTWLGSALEGLHGALVGGIRLLFNLISVMLYKVMITLYDIFDVLCSARLLDNEILDELSARVGLVLGLIMLFYVIFSFIKLLVDPDAITDKAKGAVGIVKRVLIIIVMLGVASFAFRALFSLQAAIVHNHVISKLVLPYDTKTDNFGNALAAELFTSFYRVDSAFYDDTGELDSTWASNSDVRTCEAIVFTLKDEIYERGDFSLSNVCLNEVAVVKNAYIGDQQETIIDFNWLFMIGVGILVDYFLMSYCIAVGVRMIKLAVLEIISPMAFVSYLAPKQDTMFSKWLKVYFSTYLDVFIRIGIISFAAFLCATIMDTSGKWEFWNTVNSQPKDLQKYIIAFMIVALLTFAKKAPDLLKELGFNGGAFGGFHFKDMFGGGFAKTVLGAGASLATVGTAGAIVNGVGSAVGRFQDFRRLRSDKGVPSALLAGLGGFGSAALSSYKSSLGKGNPLGKIQKGISNSRNLDNQYRELIAKGGSRTGQILSSAADLFGSARGTKDDFKIESAKKVENPLKEIFDLAENTVGYKEFMQRKQAAYNAGNVTLARQLQDAADDFKAQFVEQSLRGSLGTTITTSVGGVSEDITIGSGDGVRGNTIRTKYATAKVEIDQLKPHIYDANGDVAGDFVLPDASTASYSVLNGILKTAQNTQANIVGVEGFRAGQANKPAGSKPNNNS